MKHLVDYEDSDEDNSDNSDISDNSGNAQINGPAERLNPNQISDHPKSKKQKLPPLPSEFHDLYKTAPRTFDDPSMHEGRTRIIPHRDGFYPSHFYLEWLPPDHMATELYKTVMELNRGTSISIRSLVFSELSVPLPLHISLSEPLMIDGAHRSAFITAYRQKIGSKFSSVTAELENNLVVLTNSNSTRSFLAIFLKPNEQLQWLISAINDICATFGYPQLSPSHKPHISIGWFHGAQSSAAELNFSKPHIWTQPTVVLQRLRLKSGKDVFGPTETLQGKLTATGNTRLFPGVLGESDNSGRL